MRFAVTIILNGEHHLLHNDYFEKMIPHFDMWVFAEGASGNSGSTSWCKNQPTEFNKDGRSIDGTIDVLNKLKEKYPDKVEIVYPGDKFWPNKDIQVNTAVAAIKARGYNSGFLWQMDVDEQWTIESIEEVENTLTSRNIKIGATYCNYFVGDNTLAYGGNWGGDVPWIRCWRWAGEYFVAHEGPELNSYDKSKILIQKPMFNHYAYYFEKDVIFKSKWYGDGHEGVYEGWKWLRDNKEWPVPLNKLFGQTHYNAMIRKI